MYRIHVERGLIKREYGMAAREVRPSGEIVEVKVQAYGTSEKDDYWMRAEVNEHLSVMFTATIPEQKTQFFFYSDVGDTWRNIA
jgi:hypothetical protein